MTNRSNTFNWKCPYCGHAATITNASWSLDRKVIGTTESKHGSVGIEILSISCPNDLCKKLYLRAYLKNMEYVYGGRIVANEESIYEWQLLPKSNAKPLPDYIPESIRKDYEEACLILNDSPKAAATLARRCLQGIVRDFWDIPKNKRGNLGAEINYIKDKIDADTYSAIEAIRTTGDIGAHMEKDVNVIIEVEKEEAELLIELIETLIESWYIDRHKKEARAKAAKELAAKKKSQRRQAKKAGKEENK